MIFQRHILSRICVCLAVAAAVAASASLPDSEVTALKELYASTDGPKWVVQGGWLTNPDPCDWLGVGCSTDRAHVIRLRVVANGMRGAIPPSFCALTQLQHVDLDSQVCALLCSTYDLDV